MLDADKKPLLLGRIYSLSDAPECPNKFECVSTDSSLNDTMFVRIHDRHEHLGREFVEFSDGDPYFALHVERKYNHKLTKR